MKIAHLFGLLILFACGGQSQKGKNDNQDMQAHRWRTEFAKCSNEDHIDIVFYNVENLFDTENDPIKNDDDFTADGRNEWSVGRYEKKIINLSRVIQSIDHGAGSAAIIGLAEVENLSVVEDLANTILPNGYGVIHHESPDRRGIDLALLYRKDIVNKIDDDFIRIEFSENGFSSRDILYFKGELNGEIIHVFVNHWPSRREGQQETEHRRLEAARSLKKRVDIIQREDENAQIVILGDFNDYPNNKSLTSELGAKPKNTKEKRELVNLAYDLEMQGKGTYPYKGDWGMLDQGIITDNLMDGKGLNICEESLEIHWQEFFLFYDKKYKEYKPNRTYGGPKYYGGYSDHLPIVLHFKTN